MSGPSNHAANAGPRPTLDSASALRLAMSGQAIDALGALSAGARDLHQLAQDLERDATRLRSRKLPSPQGPARGLVEARLADEAAALTRQAEGLRHALRSLRSEAQALGDDALPAAQRAALVAQMDDDEQAAVAAKEELALFAEQAALPRAARAGARLDGFSLERGSAAGDGPAPGHALEPLDPRADRAAATPLPPELEDDLDAYARQVRELAYSQRPPRPEQMNGEEPTDARVASLQSRWADWSERSQAPLIMDPNEMTQWIMRQAYVDNSADMRVFALKMQFQTSLKGLLRDELQRARQARSDLHAGSESKDKALATPYPRKKIRKDPLVQADGAWSVRAAEDDGEIVDVDSLNDYIRDLETSLSTSSEDLQLSQLELQGMTQRQQQVLNALSSLSKVLHETSMSILRKIGN